MDREKFTAIKRDNQGRLQKFRTSTGRVYDYEMAKEMVSYGNIENAELFVGKDGETYIRGKVDGNKKNNLSNLPDF